MMIQDSHSFPNKPNWALHVLTIYGFGNAWEAQGVQNAKAFLEICKQRVKDTFIQEWHSRLETSTRARKFIHITKFNYQPYLDIINVKKIQLSLSRLRLSSHKLEIEAGRWTKPEKTPFDNRKCILCKTVEDEFHFVLECGINKDIRKQYIAKYFWAHSNMFKFIQLFSSERKKQHVI